ncbi:MAG: AAA-like domain-containing protein, partial [Cyanobacteria bacterium J06635_10]
GEEDLSRLMDLIGGHPYLVERAIANLTTGEITLEQLLNLASTEQGIFSNHLREQLWNLQHNPLLESAYKKVVRANEPVRLDAEVGFKLHSMGLVKLSGNDCVPSYDLYRRYFSERLV